jgi:hypothetical protein
MAGVVSWGNHSRLWSGLDLGQTDGVCWLQNQMTANYLKFMSRAGFQLIISFYGVMR